MTTISQINEDLMADVTSPSTNILLDSASDYGDFGSDTEEIEILDSLLARVDAGSNPDQASQLLVTDIEDYESPEGVFLPQINTGQHSAHVEIEPTSQIIREYIQFESVDTRKSPRQEREPTPPANSEPDTRSPIERFRKHPKKALSVTDLVSPAWCELQYFYTLSKHGRKKRTPAMKQGSVIHKTLEDEVHRTVPVETVKIEDNWGLRFWNICQGLKSLRETGRTRELEIWGSIGGQLVNGIIDELSYDCPDPKFEESLKAKGAPIGDLPEYQTSITEYLLAKPEKSTTQQAKTYDDQEDKWIYMTDIKTRATPTLPTGSSIRPTIIQLHLYHHMLENFAQGNFDLQTLADRYNLDIDETFSDSFLAQISDLHQGILFESSQAFTEEHILTGTDASSQDSLDLILRYNTLSSLWQYMMSQFRETFLLEEPRPKQSPTEVSAPPASQQSTSDLPPPPSQPTRLSPLLTATYLAANYKHSPSKSNRPAVLGRKSFQFDSAFLYSYLTESLSWWRGERDAKGVALQEAWKCRSCDFRNDCSWILERDQAAFDEAMKRKKMREMAGLPSEEKGEKQEDEVSRSRV